MGERRKLAGYATDIIADRSIEFLKNRPQGQTVLLMCHHKAPHRPWEPDAKHAHMFDDVTIPEPDSFNDDYATRSDAAREATMRINRDLTRNDLKLKPPADGRDNLIAWKVEQIQNSKSWKTEKPTSSPASR